MKIGIELFNKRFEVAIGMQKSAFDQFVAGSIFGTAAPKPRGYRQDEALKTYGNEIWVFACTDLIKNEICGLPLKVWKKSKKNGKDTYTSVDHPVLELIKRPNANETQLNLLESLTLNADLTGNRYLYLDELNGKIPAALHSLISSCVTIVPDKEGKALVKEYKYRLSGLKDQTYPAEQIIHGKYIDPGSNFEGLSPISAARLTIDTMQMARSTNYQLFKNGAMLDGYFFAPEPMNDDVYKRTKKELADKYQGHRNSHKTPLLEGVEFRNIAISPKDLEYLNGLKNGMVEVCAIYKVPPVLFSPEFSSYNNMLEAKKFLYQFSIIPRLRYLHADLQRLLDLWGDKSLVIEFDLSNVEALRANLKEKAETSKVFWSMGVPLNQLIEKMDLPFEPVDGGDIGYLPLGVIEAGTRPSSGTTPGTEPEKALPARKAITVKEWTEDRKVNKWYIFKGLTEMMERKYTTQLDRFFLQQKDDICSNLRKLKSIKITRAGQHKNILILSGVLQGDAVEKALDVESVLFEKSKEIKRLKKVSLPIHTDTVERSGNSEMALLDAGLSFDVTNPRVADWLEKNALDKATSVIDADFDELKQILIDAGESGASIDDIIGQMNDYFGDYAPEGYKLERIARTEIIGAANEGALESYQQAGIEKKGWLATRDDRTRDSHLDAENKYIDGIPIDQDFEVGGGTGPCPGQIGLAEEDIQCRCTILPIAE